ncbi:MAG: transposase family protein [Planctomycetes bacterium]|nr:transposase family protein [Planctomycetota bacterium]
MLRVVLSHSRKAYLEVMWRQDTESLIRGIENAFHHFGGVPKTLVPDNLKAAVPKHDWCDPTITPKFEAFARHYGVAVLPTKPRTPRHKGKVERCVAFAQDNALKGRQFASLAAQNGLLRDWETKVADQRIHGTTRKQVHALFEADERHAATAARRALPVVPRDAAHRASRRSHRDREGVLFGTARVPRAAGVGALRLAPRAHLRSRALRDRAPRPRRSRTLQHRSRAHRRREDLRDRARHRMDARARGTHRRRERALRAGAAVVSRHRRHPRAARLPRAHEEALLGRDRARVSCRAVASRVPTEDAASLARAAASSDAAARSSSTAIR